LKVIKHQFHLVTKCTIDIYLQVIKQTLYELNSLTLLFKHFQTRLSLKDALNLGSRADEMHRNGLRKYI